MAVAVGGSKGGVQVVKWPANKKLGPKVLFKKSVYTIKHRDQLTV